MSDPRGHGFNRGRGKWHARPRNLDLAQHHPVTYGWRFVRFDAAGLAVYQRDRYELSQVNGEWAVVSLSSGDGNRYPGWHIEDVTADLFGGQSVAAV